MTSTDAAALGKAGRPARLRLIDGMRAVPAAAWDRCAGTANPFLSHTFLLTLEDSRSAIGKTGWLPQHVLLESDDGRLLGCAPMYLKSHSYGEYVFDHGWADAYERAGGRYYPKLQIAVPFTPVPGPRLLIDPEAPPETAPSLIAGIEQVAARAGVSSVHVTFPTEAEWHRLGEAGWLQRLGQQYHWENQGYREFGDFLAALSSRKRKAIRKERQQVADSGIRLHALTGPAIEEPHWRAFFHFYLETGSRKWGSPYLTWDFFRLIGERLADRILLVMAESDGRWVAGALNFIGEDTLYGRNWGSDTRYPFLHFEACYYQAIEFAIRHGLKRVEAGAQGEHKLQRGYLPVPTYSAHWIADPALRRAVSDYLDRERPAVLRDIAGLGAEFSPYRQA